MISRLLRTFRRCLHRLAGRPDIPPGVFLGKNVHIARSVTFDYGYARHITIEDGVTLVGGCMICHDASSFRRLGVTWVAPVKVCRGAYVGARSILLPGVTVGEEAVVAAGSVVTRDVPPGVVVAGVPARRVETTAELDEKRRGLLEDIPIFDNKLFKGTNILPERAALLNESVTTHGGYFVTLKDQSIELESSEVH